LNVDLISITETQINLFLLDSVYNILHHLFIADSYYYILSNNSNKLIAKRQQGGILTAARGEVYSFIKGSGEDDSELGH